MAVTERERDRVVVRELTLSGATPPKRPVPGVVARQALRAALSQFTLRPHGDQLCGPTARFWIFCTRVLIMIMATAEAISWGYVGSLFGTGYMSVLTGLAAGGSLFFVIWLVDATFVTLDTSRVYYQKALSVDPQSTVDVEKQKFVAGLVIRGAIVVVSLWITAPFLAQLVFRRDIQETITTRNREAISTARAAQADKYQKLLLPLEQSLTESQQEMVMEAAGQGLSGRYGRGAAVIALENRVDGLRQQIRAAEHERDSVMSQFQMLPPTELADRFGVSIIDRGLRSRSEILNTMLDDPDYSGAQVALRSFLTFLFLGLLILKLFQPRSVGIYYSEQLQSLYTDYSQGKFDEYLDAHDRPRSGTPMTPQRFEEWCLTSYKEVRLLDDQRRTSEHAIETHERKMRTWVDELREQSELLDAKRRRYEALSAEIIDTESRLQMLNTQGETERQELARSNKTLEAITEHIATGILDVRGVERGFAAQAKVQSVIDELEQSVRKIDSQIAELALRVPLRRDEAVRLRDELIDLEAGVRNLNLRLGRERTAYHDWLSSQQSLHRRPVA